MGKDEDWRSLYPFASQHIDLDGQRYHYLDEGEGEVLLMVHGNPTWSFYWRHLVEALRDRYRIIVPDHVGCGLSDKPQQYPYTLSQHSQNLQTLVEHLDLKDVTLLAHDWGGAIGLHTAQALDSRFARFVLFNTAAFPPPHFPHRIRVCRTPLLGQLAVQGLNLFARAALSMATEKPERMTPQVCAGYLAPYDSWANRIATYQFVKDIPAGAGHPNHQILQQVEAGLKQQADRPFQFIWGMKDWCFTPACLDRFLTHLPEADVLRLEDAGHYVVEDAHERIVPVLESFLQQNRLSDSVVKPS